MARTRSLPSALEVRRAAALLGAMAHPARLHTLVVLAREGPQSVSALMQHCRMEQTALSHQLRVLRDHGLVTATREGKSVIYALADHHVAHVVNDALEHAREVKRKRTSS